MAARKETMDGMSLIRCTELGSVGRTEQPGNVPESYVITLAAMAPISCLLGVTAVLCPAPQTPQTPQAPQEPQPDEAAG